MLRRTLGPVTVKVEKMIVRLLKLLAGVYRLI